MDGPIPGAIPYIRHAAADQVMPGETLTVSRSARQERSGTRSGRYLTAALLALLVLAIFLFTIFTRL